MMGFWPTSQPVDLSFSLSIKFACRSCGTVRLDALAAIAAAIWKRGECGGVGVKVCRCEGVEVWRCGGVEV